MPAPQLGPFQSPVFRYRIGDFEVTNFSDGLFRRDDPEVYGCNRSPEEVAAVLAANHLPTAWLGNPFTVPVVNTGDRVIAFDTGNGDNRRHHGLGHLVARMKEHGPQPEEVDMVVISHCHPDHISGLIHNGAPAFPNAELVVGRKEFDHWAKAEDIPERRKHTVNVFNKIVAPLANRIRFIEPDDEVVPGITAVNCYGHSPGQLGFLLESTGERLLIWADTVNHFVLALRDPTWQFVMDDVPDQAVATRQRIFDWVAKDGLLVTGYHLPFPSLGYVDRREDGYHWVPVGYQLSL